MSTTSPQLTVHSPTQQATRPAFLIVGAPRCGTTALSQFLSQHPALCHSYVKEPHYFGSDLDTRRGFHTDEEYLTLFQDADPDQICGEASTWYLYSQCAAEEIHAFNPAAKIIIMLRNPADMLYSWHGHMVLRGQEPFEDFAQALDAEAERRQGRGVPKHVPLHKLIYTDIPRFTAQIERYRAVFDPSQIHIILYDDFKADQQRAVQDTFAFLGVDTNFTPDITVVNAHGIVKNKVLRDLTENAPAGFRQIVKTLLPRKLRSRLRTAIRRRNVQPTKRAPLAPELRQRLNREFAEEIAQLSRLLNTDLSHWTH